MSDREKEKEGNSKYDEMGRRVWKGKIQGRGKRVEIKEKKRITDDE